VRGGGVQRGGNQVSGFVVAAVSAGMAHYRLAFGVDGVQVLDATWWRISHGGCGDVADGGL
jgi:hypothetical protein